MTDASDISPNLSLPFYQTKQNEFEIQHNEALLMLDALAMLSVIDRDLTAPPDSPAQGDRYLVKATGTGGFAGQDNKVAQYDIGGWNFYAPKIGWTCYVQDERALVAWDGTAWVAALDVLAGGSLSELQNMTLLGVGTEADAMNPLSAKLNNVLWAAKTDAEGGDGTLRYKLSKESEAKTLSLLFQDNFSGRAEIGLTGDDDFHFKVSSDGTTWIEALRIDRATGKITFPGSGGPRETLTANRTYYVRTDGSNSNDGLANTSGGAFLTIQKAIDTVAALDIGVFNVTIRVADGTYTGSAIVSGPWLGSGTVTVMGNTTTPANVIISTTSADCFKVQNGGSLTVSGMELRTTTGGFCLWAIGAGSQINMGSALRFGACANYHIRTDANGYIRASGSNYSIVGGAQCHVVVINGGLIELSGLTVTLSGTPAFSSTFSLAQATGLISMFSVTWSGSATGARYSISGNGVVNTFGQATTYLPGNSAGTTATGGQYL